MWSVPREWIGETALVVAGGPSLRGFDFTRLSGRRVIAVNDSCYSVPNADYLVFTDYRWWKKHARRVRAEFRGQVVTLTPVRPDFENLLVLERQRSGGVSANPARLAWLHTTLTSACNLAGLLGASRAGLLGADGSDASDGVSWHHAPHPSKWGRNPRRYRHHASALRELAGPLAALGCTTYNLNPASTYDAFPKMTFEEFVA